MPTGTLLIVIAAVAGALYLFGDRVDGTVRRVILFVLVVVTAVWFFGVLGILPARIHLP